MSNNNKKIDLNDLSDGERMEALCMPLEKAQLKGTCTLDEAAMAHRMIKHLKNNLKETTKNDV